nr:guanylate cyclase 32E-like [Penaeus vannamei]
MAPERTAEAAQTRMASRPEMSLASAPCNQLTRACNGTAGTSSATKKSIVFRRHVARDCHTCNCSNATQRVSEARPQRQSPRTCTVAFKGSLTQSLALGALPLAVEDVNNDHNLLPGKRLVFEVADVGNSNLEALAALSIRRMTTMRDKGHLVFIGPDDNCANEALVAAAWNLPMITYKCADKRVSNKTKYYTFARTMPPSTKIVKALVSLLKVYSWRQFVLLTEHTRNYQQIKEAVKSFADHHKMNITRELSVPYDYTTSGYHTIQGFVRGTIRSTRMTMFFVQTIHLNYYEVKI